MSIELENLDSEPFFCSFDWGLEKSSWEGYEISWLRPLEYQSKEQQRVHFSSPQISKASLPLSARKVELLESDSIFSVPIGKVKQSWFDKILKSLAQGAADSFNIFNSEVALPKCSFLFSTQGRIESNARIGGINGIATTKDDALSHAEYLAKFSNGLSVNWIYNQTHGYLIDLAEIFGLNYLGISPNTSKLLQETWRAFHLANESNPEAKYLQICHSQGALHVRNALQNLPIEIRSRIIVLSIAPAAVVPNDLCFRVFNYVSKNDLVNCGELVSAGGFGASEWGESKRLELILEFRDQLIWLDPHPEAIGMDHSFQSPTFRDRIQMHIEEYISRNGIYK